jgi:hypothetical protein
MDDPQIKEELLALADQHKRWGFAKFLMMQRGKFFVADFAQRDVVWCCESYTKGVEIPLFSGLISNNNLLFFCNQY